MASIHPTAVISKECEFEEGVEIGPYCTLSGKIRLSKGVRLIGHAYLTGPLTIGEGTTVYPFSCIGFPGQDYKFKIGDPTAGVVIGKNCILRESSTVHAATKIEQPTRIGDNVMMMCGAHVGHDARLDNRAILVNGAALAGHSHVAESATISAYSALHQFGRVGRLAFVSASAALSTDVPPFCLVAHRNILTGLNLVGLRRAGVPREQITLLRSCYREVFRVHRPLPEMLEILRERAKDNAMIAEWRDFIETRRRPICMADYRDRREDEEGDEEEAA